MNILKKCTNKRLPWQSRKEEVQWRETKEPLDESGGGKSKTAGLKLNIQKTKMMASGPITSWQIAGEKMEAVTASIILGL